jgi:hypothetical protein
MGLLTIDMLDNSQLPKRGDLMQSNVGDRRERTWFIVAARRLRPTKGVPRCRIWVERWWDVEPHLRVRLFESAERRGGQRVIEFKRYPAKKRKTFEQLMGAR